MYVPILGVPPRFCCFLGPEFGVVYEVGAVSVRERCDHPSMNDQLSPQARAGLAWSKEYVVIVVCMGIPLYRML